MPKGYRFLEHVSDAYIEAYGESLEEAYEQAALALYNTITSTKEVEKREERIIEVSGEDLQSLLLEWLQKLITQFDIDGFVASEIKVEEITRSPRGYKLRAVLRGEPYDPERHRHGTHVKGATYWRMEIESEKPTKTLRFLLDI